jgi:hypothetical protein
VVPTIEDMVDAAIEMAQTPRVELARQAAQARHRFMADTRAAYGSWLRLA